MKRFPANNESKKFLEAAGWTVCVVEQTIPHAFIKRDAFGFGDLLAIHPQHGIMLVQVTAGAGRGNGNQRERKLRAEPRHITWLEAGGKIVIHNWIGKGSKRMLDIKLIMA